MPYSKPIAAIDIGTSSVHLALAQPIKGARPELILREKTPVRLGSGGNDMTSLDPEAVDRAMGALGRIKALADAHGAQIYAVATSAVREALDQQSFIDRVYEETGIVIEVISGVEEARLIHLGVLGALPLSDRRHLVIDVGGGSTELIIGEGRTPIDLQSFKVGHVRLTNRFFPDGEISPKSIKKCRTFIRSFFARAASTFAEHRVEVVAGASGTFETLTAIARHDRGTPEGSGAVTRAEIERAAELVLEHRKSADRKRIPGLESHRADTIPAGAILVLALMEIFEFDSFLLSPDALREGLVLDRIDRIDTSPDTLRHLDGIRAASIRTMAERYGEIVSHARQATDIALEVFDATEEVHQLGEFEREILEASGMLHNIGRFVGHGGHHRHSYYLIRHGEHLAGFSEHERELIALTARYHRKSAPKSTHTEYAALPKADRRRVEILAGMLRIGIALDRTYRNLASDLKIEVEGKKIEIAVIGQQDELELELYAARQRCGLLESALDRKIEFTHG